MEYDSFKCHLTAKEEQYRKRVQKKIHYCSYDQPYDSGEVVWIFGDKIELTELYFDLNIPEESWENITEHLACPSCGHDHFELAENVGLQTQYEMDIENHTKQAQKKFGGKIKEFEKHLEKNPMLGFQHSFGKKIYKELKEGNIPSTIISGEFYRARPVNSSEIYTSKKMGLSPKGKPTEGRFNHSGQSHLYLANDKETALMEVVRTEKPSLVWCQKFEIKKEVNQVLDLSFDWMDLSLSTSTLLLSLKINKAIEKDETNSEFWRPDYFLTRFIMDCAKYLGYKGIKYNSTKSYSGFNTVLFFHDEIDIHAIGKPYIEYFTSKEIEQREVMDF